jgi:hypothetical protein
MSHKINLAYLDIYQYLAELEYRLEILLIEGTSSIHVEPVEKEIRKVKETITQLELIHEN